MIFQSMQDKEAIVNIMIAEQEMTVADKGKLLELMQISANIHIGYIKNEVACVWGLIYSSLLSDQAYMWLHTTSVVKQNPISFIRGSRKIVAKALEDFSFVTGECLNTNSRAIPWLRWLGAEFQPSNERTTPFIIRRD